MVLEALRDAAPEDCIVASGVGQHQMWASQYWTFRHPYTWVNSGGLGTMGFSVPAAIGAKVGRPDRMVWAIDGDGCFQMTAQELVTAAAERIPVKIAILNNAYLGMVRQWQEMFYEERYSEVYLSPDLPDYVKWAEAMGCVAFRVESPTRSSPPSRRPTPSTTVRSSSSSAPTPPRRSSRWCPPASPTRRSRCRRSSEDPAGAGNQEEDQADDRGRHHTLSVLVENRAGVLARVVNLFSRRAYNIYSLAVAPTDDERFSRITVVVDVESAPLEQIVKQLNKLINVVKITELDPRHSVERELLLATVHASVAERPQVAELTRIFEGKIVAVSNEALTVSLEGTPKIDDFEELLRPFGIVQLQRTGRVALPKLDREPARLHAVSGIKPKVS
jgi:acetolactate synthase small subunit